MLGAIIYDDTVTADNQVGPPAMVLKRAPSQHLLHLAALVSFELRLPDGITFQVWHTCSSQQCSACACGNGSVLGPYVKYIVLLWSQHYYYATPCKAQPARARVW